MKKNLLTCAFLYLSVWANGQYYEWAKSIPNHEVSRGKYPVGFAVDRFGSALVYSEGNGCSIACHVSFLNKYNAQGDSLWQYVPPLSGCAYPSSIAVDTKGNSFITGYAWTSIYCPNPMVIAGDTIYGNNGYLIKVDSNGVAKWAVNLTYGQHVIAVDLTGNIYLTDGTKTERRNYLGNLIWTNNTKGGNQIAVDGNNKIYVLNSDSIFKLNNVTGNVIWSKNSFKGKKLSVRKDGLSYILNTDSLIKLNQSGNIVWVKSNTQGNDIAVDSLGRVVVADSSSTYRVNASGTAKNWTRYISGGYFSNVKLDINGNPYYIGSHSILDETILCPIRLFMDKNCQGWVPNNVFVGKINLGLPTSLQLGVFTGRAYSCQEFQNVPYLCTGSQLSINYSTCESSGNIFNPGNQFQLQLSDSNGSFSNPLNVGDPNAFTIPSTVPKADGYRLRTVSTNPVIVGSLNAPGCNSDIININPTIAQIIPTGNSTFCSGGSVGLNAFTDIHYSYEWFQNNSSISTSSGIIASSAGSYKLVVRDILCGCKDSSVVNVVVNSLPTASITPQGPTTFCNGDSVILTANSGVGYSYQWKVNNVNIPFAFNQSYTAKQAGNFKVKVTNSNGCTKVSAVTIVTVNCKLESENTASGLVINNFNGTISLKWDNPEYKLMSIYNLLGENVFETILPDNATYIEARNLNEGLYLFRLTGERGTIEKKILVTH